MPSQYPRLSGQHAEYVERAVESVPFRRARQRCQRSMRGVAGRLSDREIDAVADYIAGLR